MKRVAWLVTLVALFLSGRAYAGEDEALAKAKALYIEGMTSFNQGRYAQAAASILKARDVLKSRLRTVDDVAVKAKLERAVRAAEFNLAIIYYKMKQPIQSVTYLRHFLKKASPKERRDVPAEVLAQQSKVGVLIVKAPSEDATIWIEGRYVGRHHLELVMPPGRLLVSIKVKGKVVARKRIDVLAGTQPIWEVSTLNQPVATETRTSRVTRSDQDEGGQGGGSDSGGRPSKGSGGKGLGRLHWGYFAAAAGLAVVFGAAATYTGLETLKVKSDYDEAASGSQEKDDLKDKGIKYRTATNALIGVTAAVAVGAVALAVFTRWKQHKERSTETSWRILPAVGPKGAMLTFEWSH